MFTLTKHRSTFLVNDSIVQNVLIVMLASIVLAAISQIALPWQPVPLTFQSAMVVLLGLTLGSKRAVAAVALYLFEGACGLPVFAGWSAGMPILAGPTAGYLWGFLPAAFLAGWMMEQGMASNFIRIFFTAVVSASIIFFTGILWLQAMIGWNAAYLTGVKPFLILEPLKLACASLAGKFCYKKL